GAVVRSWVRRTRALHAELAEVADLDARTWWLVAGGAALPWPPREAYVASDAEPASDTFIGIPCAAPADPLALAFAARDAIRAIERELVDQPLAVTLALGDTGTTVVPSSLSTVAF